MIGASRLVFLVLVPLLSARGLKAYLGGGNCDREESKQLTSDS